MDWERSALLECGESRNYDVAGGGHCHLSLRDGIHDASNVPCDHSESPLFAEEWFDYLLFCLSLGLWVYRWDKRNGEQSITHCVPLTA